MLQGTITQLLAFAPGGSSGTNNFPLAGARGDYQRAPAPIRDADARKGYVFTNVQCPSNTCAVTVTAPGTNTVVALTAVHVGNDPSTTTLDLKTGATQD